MKTRFEEEFRQDGLFNNVEYKNVIECNNVDKCYMNIKNIAFL